VDGVSTRVTVFRVFERVLTATAVGALPYQSGPSVSARFDGVGGAALGQRVVVRGFWDGNRAYKVRFAPTHSGTWSYLTTSTDAGLDGKTGFVEAVAPTPAQRSANALYHGFLQADGFAWRQSDGAPFVPVGDTQFSFSEELLESEWQAWMSARRAQRFNSFLGCVWLGIYSRAGVPPAFANGDPTTEQLSVPFFRRLDRMVQYANDRGILMGLVIGGFPDNSNWFNRFATRARHDRWVRYVVRRYAAFNVRWVLFGEVDERNPPPGWAGPGTTTTWREEVAHSAALVRAQDPYDHPIGSHHTTNANVSDAADPNLDYVEVQTNADRTAEDPAHDQYLEGRSYRGFGKPLWFEEYWYEPVRYDADVTRGIRNTHRNFIGALAFPTMGSLMRAHVGHPDFDPSRVTTDPGALRMASFARFYAGLNTFRFSVCDARSSRKPCGRFGPHFAIFLQGGGSVSLDLVAESGTYAVSRLVIDTPIYDVAPLADVQGGALRTLSSNVTGKDVVILVRKKAAGPLADPTADDDPAPAAPGELTLILQGDLGTLAWQPPAGNPAQVDRYLVLRDGELAGFTANGETSFTLALEPGTPYLLGVVAVSFTGATSPAAELLYPEAGVPPAPPAPPTAPPATTPPEIERPQWTARGCNAAAASPIALAATLALAARARRGRRPAPRG
jgi:hypothetical protein